MLIYSIKQTLRPKETRDRSLDPKNTEGVNFQPQKMRWTSPSCILQVPPVGIHVIRVFSSVNREIKVFREEAGHQTGNGS